MKKALTIVTIISGAVCFASAACMLYLTASEAIGTALTAVKSSAERLTELVKKKIEEYNSEPQLPEFIDNIGEE